jgi:hypothetical protein
MPESERRPGLGGGAASTENVEDTPMVSTVRAAGHARRFDPLEGERVDRVMPANPPAATVAEHVGPGETRHG